MALSGLDRTDIHLFEIDLGIDTEGRQFAIVYFTWNDDAGNTMYKSGKIYVGDSIAATISAFEHLAETITDNVPAVPQPEPPAIPGPATDSKE